MNTVGNALREGIRGVWHGPRMTNLRRLHEAGRWGDIPLCADCGDRVRYRYASEEIVDGIWVRRSPLLTYYNRVERLSNWDGGARPAA